MKNRMKSGFMVALMGAGLFFTACSNNDSIAPSQGTVADGDITIAEGPDAKNPELDVNKTIYVSSMPSTQTSIQALITVTSTSSSMTRVYITENIAGAGEHPYVFPTKVDTKPDGSLDIPSAGGKNYQFLMTIPRLSMTAGSVVYKIWATDGTGDYRDTTNSLRAGIGTLTINYGGSNPNAAMKSYSAKILAAPLADGSSQSFISLVDGKLFTIKPTDASVTGAEYAALWDFGYYYGASDHASLASPKMYPDAVVNIPNVAQTTDDNLNACFFKKSTKTSTDFDAIALSSDLDFVSVPNDAASQIVTGLAGGSILEFIDNYGHKGMIRVVKVQGTYGSADYIDIDVKVQP